MQALHTYNQQPWTSANNLDEALDAPVTLLKGERDLLTLSSRNIILN